MEKKNAETDKHLERELSITAETGTGSDNGKLNRKKRKIFKKYSDNDREVAQLTQTLKQKLQAKAQRISRYEKRETQYIQKKMFKEDTNKFYRHLVMKNIKAREPLNGSSVLMEVTVWRKRTA